MPATYESFATNTLGSNTASVTFSSIPSTYTDLILIVASLDTSGPQQFNLRLNGDTGSNYNNTRVIGNGTSALTNRGNSETAMNIGFSSNAWGTSVFQFMNYFNTTTFKNVLSRSGQSASEDKTTIGLWRNTSAITSIVLFPSSGSFLAGSTFTLYGIKAA